MPQQLQLPREDIKITVRPRDRLNITKLSDALIRDGVLRAATVTIAEAEDDIYRSCVRPMGNTNSVIIIFEGPKGREYRYYLHKKKVEVCGACGRTLRLWHRMWSIECIECGAQNPTDNHNCNPSCALCGKDHPTGDKRCRKRFQTPFLIKQRHRRQTRKLPFSFLGLYRRAVRNIILSLVAAVVK
ncbi:hypothetical protein HPB47_018136 [Ixodes persulcatus]|uniref:Uncharacterized protein n=1 Tax=Ixodes persulcatus TaxID=34615 RepID=A0AC60QLJ6_IXOPE|nr:hypothetical protein HPB47_018136 [Ixodes persulcatus]